jgi:hypothetical protein
VVTIGADESGERLRRAATNPLDHVGRTAEAAVAMILGDGR